MCIGISTPLQKHHPLSCQPPPLKSANCPSPLPFLGNPPSILVFRDCSFKVGFFSEPPKYQSFLSLTSSYLLKVTKFLVKISQFKFSVMAEKNIFAYHFSLSINISDLNLFLTKNCNPPPLTPQPPPLLKIWLEVQPPPPNKKGWRWGGVHTVL